MPTTPDLMSIVKYYRYFKSLIYNSVRFQQQYFEQVLFKIHDFFEKKNFSIFQLIKPNPENNCFYFVLSCVTDSNQMLYEFRYAK